MMSLWYMDIHICYIRKFQVFYTYLDSVIVAIVCCSPELWFLTGHLNELNLYSSWIYAESGVLTLWNTLLKKQNVMWRRLLWVMGGNHYIMLLGKCQDTVTMGIASLRNHHVYTCQLQSKDTLNCFRKLNCLNLVSIASLRNHHACTYPLWNEDILNCFRQPYCVHLVLLQI